MIAIHVVLPKTAKSLIQSVVFSSLVLYLAKNIYFWLLLVGNKGFFLKFEVLSQKIF